MRVERAEDGGFNVTAEWQEVKEAEDVAVGVAEAVAVAVASAVPATEAVVVGVA